MSLTLGNIAFQALSFIVLGVFCRTVYAYRGQVSRCFGNTVVFSRTTFSQPEATALYNNFLSSAMTLGALSVGLAVVKALAWMLAQGTEVRGTIVRRLADLAGTGGVVGLPSWVAPAAAVAVALGVMCVVLVEVGVLKAVGGLTLSAKFTDGIVRTKKNWMAAASMLTVPLVAIWTGVNPQRDIVIVYLLAIVLVILAALFVVHTLRSFIKQKVSLLVWFLYLCTVEIFPICAVMLAVARNI